MSVFGGLSVALLGGSVWLLQRGWTAQDVGPSRAASALLLGLALLGHLIPRHLLGRATPAGVPAFGEMPPGTVSRLLQPDGALLHVLRP